MPKTKVCNRCKKRKSLASFNKQARAKDGLQARCRDCCSVEWHAKYKQKEYEADGVTRTTSVRDRQKRYVQRLRQEAFDTLGRCCVRCGFDDERALQFDHINGGGTQEVRRLGPHMMYRKIISGDPGYQVLCANCNWIKRCENGEVPLYRQRRIT